MQKILRNAFYVVFDSSGKLPNGIYADTLEFCEFLDQYAPLLGFPPISCEQISEGLYANMIILIYKFK